MTMTYLIAFAFCFSVVVGSPFSNTTCADFRYYRTCLVSSDNLAGEVDVDVIGDTPANCQKLCHSVVSCNWFNYFVGDKCQLLRYCKEFQNTHGALSGPTTPDIESCHPCHDFHYLACVVLSANLEGEIDVDLIGDSAAACQDLCLTISTCSWFNYYKGEQCQLLAYCDEYEVEQYAVSGPTAPSINSCGIPPFNKVIKITIDSCTLYINH